MNIISLSILNHLTLYMKRKLLLLKKWSIIIILGSGNEICISQQNWLGSDVELSIMLKEPLPSGADPAGGKGGVLRGGGPICEKIFSGETASQ